MYINLQQSYENLSYVNIIDSVTKIGKNKVEIEKLDSLNT